MSAAVRQHQPQPPRFTAPTLRAARTEGNYRQMTTTDDTARRDQARARIELQLDAAERLFKHPDPYRRQAAYSSAVLSYSELAPLHDDPTVRMALSLASAFYQRQSALVRWQHRIPTITPGTDVALIGLAQCDECGRPWQVDTAGACPQCPRPLFGPSPTSFEEAAQLPAGVPADLSAPEPVDD